MKNKRIYVLIAETDNWFKNRLIDVLHKAEEEMEGVSLHITEANSLAEIGDVLKENTPHIALIEHTYFVKKPDVKQIATLLEGSKKKCEVVMLISHEINQKIYNAIENINNFRSLQLSGHLLKENYSRDLIKMLLKFLIKRVFIN
ncbi:MAG TPA: hypothetical protein VNY73_06185 [Bacteroidia bacterium]|nr:hypothetical protein [Bacteroidia bacterium]